MDELKPCPFCGGDAAYTADIKMEIEEKGYREVSISFVNCTVCGARAHAFDFDDYSDAATVRRLAVAAWNLRKREWR